MGLVSSFTLMAAVLAAPQISPDHSHEPQLGTISFDTSCSAEAESSVLRGLGWLHSFEYEQAARIFREALAADPECGIAYWGVAASHYHPLWAPPGAQELESGRAAIASAKSTGAKTQRERDYIDALTVFYESSDRLDHKTRAMAYSAALQQLHARYPEDREAAVFYALSLIAAGTMDQDPSFKREKEAAEILNEVLAEEPNHPGVSHYLIHSFDYPSLAELALPAAKRYASIAPASPHAQHMPSHIFVRLGLWEEAIKSNLASEAAARTLATEQGLPDSSSERLHAMDYLTYAYLQAGQASKAEGVYAELRNISRADPPSFAVAYSATAIPARLLLERRRWKDAASLQLPANVERLAPLDTFKWAQAHLHFARGVGAARIGDTARAREELGELRTLENSITVPLGSYDWRTQVAINRQIVEGWLAYAEGRQSDALRIMREAAQLDDSTEKHPVTPGSILPAREQLGELLLLLNRPVDALAEFESSLERAPGRFTALYGAGNAALLAGEATKARSYFAQFLERMSDGDQDLSEILEAKASLAQLENN